jgi:antitoxin component HigA of HigAB toxin-antitoxin module
VDTRQPSCVGLLCQDGKCNYWSMGKRLTPNDRKKLKGLSVLEAEVEKRGGITRAAPELGISYPHLSRLVSGSRRITLDIARVLQERWGIPLSTWL